MGKCNQPCRNTWNSPSITFKFEIKKGFKKCLTLWVFQYFWWKQVSEHQLILHYYHHLRLWSYQNHFFVIWSLCNTKMTLCQILKLGTLFFRLELKGFCINFFSSLSSICWVVKSFYLPCIHTQCKLFHQAEFPRISQLLQFLSLKPKTTQQWHLMGQ